MTARYYVESFHVNIGLGDAAIHVLAKEESTPKTRTAEKIVWIDGGKGGDATMKRFWQTVTDIKKRYSNLDGSGKEFKFDAIVITHFDQDHHGGFVTAARKKNSELISACRTTDPITKLFCPDTSCHHLNEFPGR